MILIIIIIFIAIIAAVVYAGFKYSKLESEKKAQKYADGQKPALSPENEKILKISKQLVLDERMLSNKLKNEEVRGALTPALDKAEEILKVLKSQPEEIQNTKQFINYYIPTIDTVLKEYLKLESSNVDITNETEKVLSYIADINKAMDRQYQNLFDDDKLDLSVEMEAMTLALQRDGLIEESQYKAEDQTKAAELTLM